MEISGVTANFMWLEALEEVLTYGQTTYPRGFTCLELLNCHLQTDMGRPIVTNSARKLGYKFMFAEAAWILSGDDRVKTIKPYSKIIEQFSDNGETFFGAYGPKILDQIDYVCRTLAADHWSRQAVINIWRENPPITKDPPCTLSAQFIIRNGKLNCIDTMRSSDLWLGIPYDTFNFSMLSSYIILRMSEFYNMNLELGDLHLNLGSLHLYERDIQHAHHCILPHNNKEVKFKYQQLDPIHTWESYDHLVEWLWDMAKQGINSNKFDWK